MSVGPRNRRFANTAPEAVQHCGRPCGHWFAQTSRLPNGGRHSRNGKGFMNITIVGSGNVGRALGAGWRKAGHSVTFAARDPASAKAAELKKEGFAVAPQADAGKDDVIVLAVPWTGIEATVQALGPLAGKVVVDATNPLTANLELALGFSDSAGETVARLAKA